LGGESPPQEIILHLLEAGEQDIEFADGNFKVAGTDRAVSLKDVAKAAFNPTKWPKGFEGGLYENATFKGEKDTYPNGCAVDPVSGNLALAGGSPHDYQANVAIFAHAKGPPTLYSDPTAPEFDFCTYDDRGNLFANEYGSETFALDELANGSGSLTPVDVNQGSQTISAGGAVQWDGEYLILGDPHGNGSRHGPTTIYQVALSGSKGSIVKTIELYSGKTAYGKPNRNPGTPVEFWIQGKTIVNPLKYSRGVAIWRYPGGGRPTKNIFRLRLAYGITLSSAPK